MATVPIINKDVQLRGLNAPTLGASIRPVDRPYVKSTGLETVGNTVMSIAEDMKKRADQTALLEAQKKLDDWESANIFDPKQGILTRKGQDAMGLSISVNKKFDDDMQAIYEGLGNEDQRAAFQKMAMSRRDNIMRTTFSHERQETDGYEKMAVESAAKSSATRAALYYNNADVRNAAMQTAMDTMSLYLDKQGIKGDVKDQQLAEFKGSMNYGILQRTADVNPKAAIDFFNEDPSKFGSKIIDAQRLIAPTERKYKAGNLAQEAMNSSVPATTPDAAIKFNMYSLEGGDKVVPDGNGHISKFGIRTDANRSAEFVSNLTPEDAAKIYKDEYWNWAVKEGTSPDFALVAFDAAVQHGADARTKKMIDNANGDPEKLIALRRDYYIELAKKPENANKLEGWMNRLGKVQAQVEMMRGTLPDENDVMKSIDNSTTDIELASDAKQIVSKKLKEIKDRRTEAETSAARDVAKLEADGSDVPPSLIARMSPEKQKDYYAKAYDPMEYERVRDQVAHGVPVDLEAYRFRIKPAMFDDLVSMQGDSVKQETARLIDKNVREKVKNATGKEMDKIKTPEDYEKLQNLRKLIYNGVDAFASQNKRQPKKEEVEKIAGSIMREQGHGWFDSESYKFKGIPDEGTFMVGGSETSRAEIVALASKHARAMNLPVTPETLGDIYKLWKKQGLVVEKYGR